MTTTKDAQGLEIKSSVGDTKIFAAEVSSELEELPFELQRPRLRRQQASRYLALRWDVTRTPATLAKLASIGGGPRFQRFGRFPLYPREELDAWVQTKFGGVVSSTSELDG